jgi:hypothetical protein
MAIDTYTRSFAEILTQVSKIKSSKLLNYFTQKRLRNLVESIGEF